MSDTRNFFADLSVLSSVEGLSDLNFHQPAPADWCVAMVDIVNSTEAVTQGRYRDVNMASACAITAVLNQVGEARKQVAYVFGGDGATFLIPSTLKEETAFALEMVRRMVKQNFGLDMRMGMVNVSDLLQHHQAPVKVAKIEMAPGLYQAAFFGQGLLLAEKMIKDSKISYEFEVGTFYDKEKWKDIRPNFLSMRCLWRSLPSRNGLNVSLIVQGVSKDDYKNAVLYQMVLERIGKICGYRENWRPLSKVPLHLSDKEWSATTMKTSNMKCCEKAQYYMTAFIVPWLGKLCGLFGWRFKAFDVGTYERQMIDNSDYIKFDGALRLVMDVTVEQKAEIQSYMDDLLHGRKAFYGLHISFSALMICPVFNFEGKYLHFIDGAEGGYSLAAIQMKHQMQKVYSV